MSGVAVRLAGPVALVIGLAALPALADGFTTDDLGYLPDRATCMARANQAFEIYGRETGQTVPVSEGAWSVSGWDIMPGAVDINIICPIIDDADGVNAFAVGHSPKENNTRQNAVARIRDIFLDLR